MPSAAPPEPAPRATIRAISDLRLDLGLQPAPTNVDDVHAQGSGSGITSGTYSEKPAHDPGYGARLSYLRGDLADWGGVVYGAGLTISRNAMKVRSVFGGERDHALTCYGAVARVGYGRALTDAVWIEFTPFIGGGRAKATWSDSASAG